ncbi:hypothetical protein MRX96_030505 [Rhipicephalus microplus]
MGKEGEEAVVITAASAGVTSRIHHYAHPTMSYGLGVCVAGQSDATPELRGSRPTLSLLALASVFLLIGPRWQFRGTESHRLHPGHAPTPLASPGPCGAEMVSPSGTISIHQAGSACRCNAGWKSTDRLTRSSSPKTGCPGCHPSRGGWSTGEGGMDTALSSLEQRS